MRLEPMYQVAALLLALCAIVLTSLWVRSQTSYYEARVGQHAADMGPPPGEPGGPTTQGQRAQCGKGQTTTSGRVWAWGSSPA